MSFPISREAGDGSLNWEEISGSNISTHSIDSGNADVRIFRVKWSLRYTFSKLFAGKPHPELIGCYCNRIRIEPWLIQGDTILAQVGDPTLEVPSYNYARITVDFATDFSVFPWPCDVDKPSYSAGTQLKFVCRIQGQFLKVEPAIMRYADNPDATATGHVVEADSQATRILITTNEYHLEWLYVNEPPINDWDDNKKGRVNNASFLGCAPETLLFEGFDCQPSTRFDIDDPFAYRLPVIFRERRINVGDSIYGWNHELRHDGWQRIKMIDGSGSEIDRYPLADFSGMFTVSTCTSSSSSGV